MKVEILRCKMYLKTIVEIPDVKGKITRKTKGETMQVSITLESS